MEATQSIPCEKKVRRIQEFHETTLDYSGAIDRVRRKYEIMRDLLTRHIVEHGC